MRLLKGLIWGALLGLVIGASMALFHAVTGHDEGLAESLFDGVGIGLGLAAFNYWLTAASRD